MKIFKKFFLIGIGTSRTQFFYYKLFLYRIRFKRYLKKQKRNFKILTITILKNDKNDRTK
jgi:hypothetical protein